MFPIIIYFILLIVNIYFCFLYRAPILLGTLVVLLGYPILAFSYIFMNYKNILVRFLVTTSSMEKGQQSTCNLQIQNNSKYLFQFIKIKLFHIMNGQLQTKEYLPCSIPSHTSKVISYPFYATQCGHASFIVVEYNVYDFLGMFFIKKKSKVQTTIKILPSAHLILTEVSRKTRDFIAEADTYSNSRSGEDPSEIYQIRPYIEGDAIHSIHWKLTAKDDTLMVKEQAHPLGCVVLVWLDFMQPVCNRKRTKGHRKSNGTALDVLIELASSVSISLITEHVIHQVSWFDCKTHQIMHKRIENAEDLYELLHTLIIISPYYNGEYVYALYEDAFPVQQFSSIIKIDLSGVLRVNQLEYRLTSNEIKKQLATIVLEV